MKRLLLDGPELRRDIPPAPVTRAEPVVRLRSGLTLDDRSCWQYPTMLVGSVGSGKSTLLDQIQQPVLAHAAKAGDAVVIFAAKPDVLRYRRPGDPVISVSASDPGSRWDIFAELNHAANPMLMLMYGKEASNRKQEIDRQHYTIPNQRPKDKHCGKI